jgi:nitroreductase
MKMSVSKLEGEEKILMFLSLIQERRSIRKFLNHPVEPEKVEQLMEAALRSPSSRSLNPWEFIVVNDPVLLRKMAIAKPHGAAFLRTAPLGVVICADSQKCDVWIEDASVATTYIMLAAQSLGLGSCWVQIRLREHNVNQTAGDYLRELLDLPEYLKVESVIAIGYPAENPPPHPKEELQYEKVHYNTYSGKKT